MKNTIMLYRENQSGSYHVGNCTTPVIESFSREFPDAAVTENKIHMSHISFQAISSGCLLETSRLQDETYRVDVECMLEFVTSKRRVDVLPRVVFTSDVSKPALLPFGSFIYSKFVDNIVINSKACFTAANHGGNCSEGDYYI